VSDTVAERLDAVRSLAAMPLYQLSTAGMELFHTNMLYWLAVNRLAESKPLWYALGLQWVGTAPQEPFIRREWRHLDLAISLGPDQAALVIENKIGAIPTDDQLRRYAHGLDRTPLFALGATGCVLLTLTRTRHELPQEPRRWHPVTYGDLLPAFRETAERMVGDDRTLMHAYVALVELLDKVAGAYDPSRDLEVPVMLSTEERESLHEARLLSLVEKVRAGRFAEHADEKLRDGLGATGHVGAGLSNGSAFNEWFVAGPNGRRFGWQIQGGQFRLAVVTGPDDPRARERREALVEDLYASFFDFAVPDSLRDTIGRYADKKAWLGYEPNFVYRFVPLTPGTTWDDLLALVEWFTGRIVSFAQRRP